MKRIIAGLVALTLVATGWYLVPARAETPETESTVTAPAETEPTETIPVETEPVETTPVETEPAETAPVETVPVETTAGTAEEEAAAGEQQEALAAFAERMVQLNPALLTRAAEEIVSMDAAQRQQVTSIWTENVFDRLSPGETADVYGEGTELSRGTMLVLIMANVDMGVRYISEHFSEETQYLLDFQAAYENIYTEMSAVDNSGLTEEAYLTGLYEAFTSGFTKLIEVNWQEQEETEAPEIVAWGYHYFDGQCDEDVQECLAYLASFAEMNG